MASDTPTRRRPRTKQLQTTHSQIPLHDSSHKTTKLHTITTVTPCGLGQLHSERTQKHHYTIPTRRHKRQSTHETSLNTHRRYTITTRTTPQPTDTLMRDVHPMRSSTTMHLLRTHTTTRSTSVPLQPMTQMSLLLLEPLLPVLAVMRFQRPLQHWPA